MALSGVTRTGWLVVVARGDAVFGNGPSYVTSAWITGLRDYWNIVFSRFLEYPQGKVLRRRTVLAAGDAHVQDGPRDFGPK